MDPVPKKPRLIEQKGVSPFSIFPVEIRKEILDYASLQDLESIGVAIPELLVLIREKREEWIRDYKIAGKDTVAWAFGHLMDFMFKQKICDYTTTEYPAEKKWVTRNLRSASVPGIKTTLMFQSEKNSTMRTPLPENETIHLDRDGCRLLERPESAGFADVFSALYKLYPYFEVQLCPSYGVMSAFLRDAMYETQYVYDQIHADELMEAVLFSDQPHNITEPKVLRLLAKYKDLPILGVGGLCKIKYQ